MTMPSRPEPADATARPAVLIAAAVIAALTGFAANSLLTRAALGPRLLDPATFTTVRIASGALTLALLAGRASRLQARSGGGSWMSAWALFAYALTFSFAYVRIDAGPGALILFGAVQATMIGWGLRRGERPHAREWMGLVVALAGLVWLTLPGSAGADLPGALLMGVAGAAWGIYSLRGRGEVDPLGATAVNFARAAVPAVAVSLVLLSGARAAPLGVLLAVVSGSLASGVGYTLWYTALPHLTATRAAVAQLAVPVLTAAGAVTLLGEIMTPRMAAAGAAILGGVAVSTVSRGSRRKT